MNTNIKKGLSDKEVLVSRKKYGSNRLDIKNRNTFFKLIIESLNDPIIKILLVALGIKIVFLFKDSNVFETLGIAIAVFLASFISAISEYGSEKEFEKLSKDNNSIKVKVIRNSRKTVINIEELVVGDIVLLSSGERIPADGKIIEGSLYVDESPLTGETDEKYKTINDKVYMGCVISNKNAIMIVDSVGLSTHYGKIANQIQEKNIPSPLKTKLTKLASLISIFGYIGALLVFLSYMFNAVIVKYNYDFNIILNIKILLPHLIYALTLSVAVVVMAVPEGLPMMITLVLSSNMKKLLKRNVLVRKLVGIESAGSLNVLLTDKTGTLTEGILNMTSFITPDYLSINNNDDLKKLEQYELIYQSLVYNNDSFINDNDIQGSNSTDRAILSFINTDNKSKYKIIKKIDFSSKLKYSSVTTNYKNKSTFYKGASEVIIKKCTRYIDSNNKEHILLERDKILDNIKKMTDSSKRLLCVAYENDDKFNNLTLLGFIVLNDKIRKEAYEGLSLIKNAGIDVIMVTGDSKETAESIAKELNILDNNGIVLTSDEFNKLNDVEIINIFPRLKVLCRSMPEDKYRLVKIAESLDLVVGMTGDGVNDAPALRKASIGFSMGSGTEIAKETSDIVILDDNIMSIATAILYGRTVFKSIRKFIIFQLSVNVCAVLLSIIGPFIGVLSPITVIQVLWVNMVMDTFSGLAFSFEPALIEYMKERPKKRNESIINSYMINQIVLDGLYSMLICIWFLKSNFIKSLYRIDINNKYIMTAFFGMFIFIDIFNAFNARTHRINTFSYITKNKLFIIIFVFITIVQVLLIYYGGELFRTSGLTLKEFVVMLFVSFSVIPFDILRKILMKKKRLDMSI